MSEEFSSIHLFGFQGKHFDKNMKISNSVILIIWALCFQTQKEQANLLRKIDCNKSSRGVLRTISNMYDGALLQK